MKKILKRQAGTVLAMLTIVLLAGMSFTAPADENRSKRTRVVVPGAKVTTPAVSPVPLADESLIDPNAANGKKNGKARTGQNSSQDQSKESSRKKTDRR